MSGMSKTFLPSRSTFVEIAIGHLVPFSFPAACSLSTARLSPLPSGGGLDADLVDDGACALHRWAFAHEVEPARNIAVHIEAGAEAFDTAAVWPETDIGDGIEIARAYTRASSSETGLTTPRSDDIARARKKGKLNFL
jgi:hypothetical protein